MKKYILILTLLLVSFSCTNKTPSPAYSSDACLSHPADLWKGIVAEAAGEGYQGMYAVCCVVRNRLAAGMPHSLTGMQRKDLERFVKHEYGKTQQDAIKAVREVFCNNFPDITLGALYFESEDFITPKWFTGKIILVRFGKHYFYNYRSNHVTH